MTNVYEYESRLGYSDKMANDFVLQMAWIKSKLNQRIRIKCSMYIIKIYFMCNVMLNILLDLVWFTCSDLYGLY